MIAFKVGTKIFENKVKLMGFKNVPIIFQRNIDYIFENCIKIFCLVYIDGILFFSENIEEYLEHLKITSAKLRKYVLKCNKKSQSY